jgi:hypothetical protein
MKTILISIAILTLSGCAQLGGYQSMSPDQLIAMAKMKDATVNCIKGSTVWTGPYYIVMVQMDKGVIPEGGITVDGDCQLSMTNTKVIKTITTTPITR